MTDIRIDGTQYIGSGLYLIGTDARDRFLGSDQDDYIDSKGGAEWYVKGGPGRDYFVFDSETDILRLVDFERGQDKIVIASPDVFDQFTFSSTSKGQAVLERGVSKLLLDGVDVEDLEIGDFVFQESGAFEPTIAATGDGRDADPAVAASRLDRSSYTGADQWLVGTASRDRLNGGDGDDYIDSKGGREFSVYGGEGSDYFVLDRHTDILRIFDFEPERDKIVLDDRATFDQLAFSTNSKGQGLIVSGDAKVLLDNVRGEDLTMDDFVLRETAPPPTRSTPDNDVNTVPVDTLMIVVTVGQSLSVGATDVNTVLSSTPQYPDRAFMLDYGNPTLGSIGFGRAPVDAAAFEGLTPLVESLRETPSSAMINRFISSADQSGTDLPGIVHFHVGAGGLSILELMTREQDIYATLQDGLAAGDVGYVFAVDNLDGTVSFYADDGDGGVYYRDEKKPYFFSQFTDQLALILEYAQGKDIEITEDFLISFIQGQADNILYDGFGYDHMLSQYFERLLGEAEAILGTPIDLTGAVSQTRGVGSKSVSLSQLEFTSTHPDLTLGALEVQFNTSRPSVVGDFAHLTGEGYNLLGQHIGDRLFDAFAGVSNDPITIEAVTPIASDHLVVDFRGVEGFLVDDPAPFRSEAGFVAPSHFGFELYNDRSYKPGAAGILDARIIGPAQVELIFDQDIVGPHKLYLGRTEDKIFTTPDGVQAGRAFGGTTLRDSVHETADPVNSEFSQNNEMLFDYAPIQVFDFII